MYNEWQFQALGTGNWTKKGIKIAPKKDQISISCKNAYLHIMSFITTKSHVILLSGFSGVVLTKCFSIYLSFSSNFEVQKERNSEKKNGIKSCANKKNSSIFHFGQISKFKKGVTPRKKIESKFPVDMRIYTFCPS